MELTQKTSREITWKEIKDMVDKEEITLKVGDEIEEKLINGKRLWLAVAAVNLYQPGEIIFVQKNIVGYSQMNEKRTNEGGWPMSDLRAKLKREIYSRFPDDLRDVITPRTISQTIGGKTTTSTDHLWLPSQEEYTGTTIYGIEEAGDKQFDYYRNPVNRVSVNNDHDPTWKWTRTPSADITGNFRGIYSSGDRNYNNASSTSGVALSFWIRKS